MSAIKLWWLSLAIAGAVVGVVVALLGLIIATAKSIDRHAGEIWIEGKKIAGNTVSIWMLKETKEHVSRIEEVAGSLAQTAASIDEKLRARAGTAGERS